MQGPAFDTQNHTCTHTHTSRNIKVAWKRGGLGGDGRGRGRGEEWLKTCMNISINEYILEKNHKCEQ
jgi:hypothetical protein